VSFVREIYKKIYKHDAYCKNQDLDDDQRLSFHQEHSGLLMEKLREWLIEKIGGKTVEPNSSLGEAINYIANQWPRLTAFLQYPGVPLDSNLVEQIIKLIIRYRNNSRVYKTQNGADVADRLRSIIYTAILHSVNPVDYLTWCLINKEDLKTDPVNFTPWAYKEYLNAQQQKTA